MMGGVDIMVQQNGKGGSNGYTKRRMEKEREGKFSYSIDNYTLTKPKRRAAAFTPKDENFLAWIVHPASLPLQHLLSHFPKHHCHFYYERSVVLHESKVEAPFVHLLVAYVSLRFFVHIPQLKPTSQWPNDPNKLG
jgi:hypothetical protein